MTCNTSHGPKLLSVTSMEVTIGASQTFSHSQGADFVPFTGIQLRQTLCFVEPQAQPAHDRYLN